MTSVAVILRWIIRRLGAAAHELLLSIVSAAQVVRGHLRFRSNYIVERWPGDRRLEGAKRIAIFVHYDPRGCVHDYVLHYLTALLKAGFEIVFVSNSPPRFCESLPLIRPLCGLIIRRKNVGYDFGAYKDSWFALPNLAQLDELILANDSAYGPFSDLAPLLSRCNDSAAIWGMTDSWDRRYHLQSYFLLFKKPALNSPLLSTFWRKVRYVQSKRWIIRKYEVRLTQEAIHANLKCAALFPQHQVIGAFGSAVLGADLLQRDGISENHRAYLRKVFSAVDRGSPLNITHFFWDYLIGNLGFPFLKRELLAYNPMRIPFVHQWQNVIQRATHYDPDLIMQHLKATLRNRAV